MKPEAQEAFKGLSLQMLGPTISPEIMSESRVAEVFLKN